MAEAEEKLAFFAKAVVGELGYGSGPVVLRGSNSAAPVTAPGLSGSFSLACSPEAGHFGWLMLVGWLVG